MKQQTIKLFTRGQRGQAAELILNTPDKPKMEIVYRLYKPVRSGLQNDKFHAMVGEVAKHIGYLPDEMKGVIKWKFKIRRTSELNKMQMADLIEQLYVWGSHLGVNWSEDFRQ